MGSTLNARKFACASCIKGHRVSGCTHTDRPRFELKKKGRPSTQCMCCKAKRKSNSVHNACVCGDGPSIAPPPEHHVGSSRGSGSWNVFGATEGNETSRGQLGSSATLATGLKHGRDRNAVVVASSGHIQDPMRSVERNAAHTLYPCSCRYTGICKCCEPKRRGRKGLDPETPSSCHSHTSGAQIPDREEHSVELSKARTTSGYSGSGWSTLANPNPMSPTKQYSSSLAPPKPRANPSPGSFPQASGSSTRHSWPVTPGPFNPHDSLAHKHRASGSVGQANPTAAYLPIQGLPIATASASDEMRQEVSSAATLFPPRLDEPEMAALVNQLLADERDEGGEYEHRGDGEFSSGVLSFGRSELQQHQQIGLAGQEGRAGRGGQEELYNMLYQATLGLKDHLKSIDPRSELEADNGGTGVQAQPAPIWDVPLANPNNLPALPTYFPQCPDSTSQTEYQRPDSQPPVPAPADSLHQARDIGLEAFGYSNLIDLSRPLNAEHVDRIIKALQMPQPQWAQSDHRSGPPYPPNTGAISAPRHMTSPPVIPLPRYFFEINQQQAPVLSPLPNPGLSDPFGPFTLSHNTQQPSPTICSYDSFLAPSPSGFSGSGSGHLTLISGDGTGMSDPERDDMLGMYYSDNVREELEGKW